MPPLPLYLHGLLLKQSSQAQLYHFYYTANKNIVLQSETWQFIKKI
jgi:hypothetical protein